MRPARTLRFRLTVGYCTTLAIVMLLLGALMYGIVRYRLLRHHDAMLTQKVTQIRAILETPGASTALTSSQLEPTRPTTSPRK